MESIERHATLTPELRETILVFALVVSETRLLLSYIEKWVLKGHDSSERLYHVYDSFVYCLPLELKKVVYDSKVGSAGHERAGDYLPLLRASGQRSANLCFNVPGFALGGVAVAAHVLSEVLAPA